MRNELGSIPRSTANYVPGLCNGSTTDFDSVSLGSIPSPGARLIRCDYVVMVATQIVILLAWVRSPLVTPNKFMLL